MRKQTGRHFRFRAIDIAGTETKSNFLTHQGKCYTDVFDGRYRAYLGWRWRWSDLRWSHYTDIHLHLARWRLRTTPHVYAWREKWTYIYIYIYTNPQQRQVIIKLNGISARKHVWCDSIRLPNCKYWTRHAIVKQCIPTYPVYIYIMYTVYTIHTDILNVDDFFFTVTK